MVAALSESPTDYESKVFIQSIHHVQVAALPGCETAARRFYGEILGLKELEKPDSLTAKGGCWFELAGGQQLHVGTEIPHHPARKAHPCLAVDHFDEFRQRLLNNALDVKDDTELPDVRRFFSHDPFGNRLEFVERSA